MDILGNLIAVWDMMLAKLGYTRVGTKKEKKEHVGKYDIPEVFAKALKNYALSDRKLEIVGTSNRAETLNNSLKYLNKNLSNITIQMLQHGGVVAVPYAKENAIYLDVVAQNNFEIESMAGDKILDCVVLADVIEDKKNNVKYTLFRRYKLENKLLTITNMANKNSTPILLTDVPEWAEIPEQVVIQNVEKMPFAFFKNPIDSRTNGGKKGVPVTHGQEKLVAEIEECLCQVETEFGAKQVRLFVDSVLFNADEKLDAWYKKVNAGDGSSQFETFDPAFRQSSYYERLMFLFALLEKKVGTSAGILTPFESKDATATAIKQAALATYNMTEEIREQITTSINDYIQGCELLINYNNLVQFGDYELNIEFGYNIAESSTESFEQLMQAQAVGAVSTAEVRQFVRPNESKEDAEKAVAEIEKSQPTIASTFGV